MSIAKTTKTRKNTIQGVKPVSKLGKWIDAHPKGIVVVVDRKSVNK